MSHFIGLVFGSNVEENLSQYDENVEVEAYIRYTKQQAIDKAKESISSGYYWCTANMPKEKIESLSTDEEYYQYALEAWGGEADEQGNLLTTYNPFSKWDWYTEGGRWRGYLPTKYGYNSDNCVVGDVDWDKFFENNPSGPFCFVTEDGEWHETARMGWWGMTTDDKEDSAWREEFESYLKSVDPETEVTAIDFHI